MTTSTLITSKQLAAVLEVRDYSHWLRVLVRKIVVENWNYRRTGGRGRPSRIALLTELDVKEYLQKRFPGLSERIESYFEKIRKGFAPVEQKVTGIVNSSLQIKDSTEEEQNPLLQDPLIQRALKDGYLPKDYILANPEVVYKMYDHNKKDDHEDYGDVEDGYVDEGYYDDEDDEEDSVDLISERAKKEFLSEYGVDTYYEDDDSYFGIPRNDYELEEYYEDIKPEDRIPLLPKQPERKVMVMTESEFIAMATGQNKVKTNKKQKQQSFKGFAPKTKEDIKKEEQSSFGRRPSIFEIWGMTEEEFMNSKRHIDP